MSGNPPKTCRGEKWKFHEENFYMKKSRFSDSQIIEALKRVESGFGVPDICRELGISDVPPFSVALCFGVRG